ncbi:MAG: cardiolipin synthase [Blastopirellula sp.]|nr:MAG: cardiolipin synthase [Blastopirellula sp.]
MLGVALVLTHLIGLATSVDAIMHARTPQGGIAWALTLIYLPYFALPAYWIFGRSKFEGYIDARRMESQEIRGITYTFRQFEARFVSRLDKESPFQFLEELAEFPFTTSNHVELLIDGQKTFDAIFKAIDEAEEYILIQFFIVRSDDLGTRLQQKLIEKAKAGIRVYFLYDEIGSHQLPNSYLIAMREAGIEVRAFHTTKGKGNRFQLNFRNHRKIVITDGTTALVGGHNVGDEYLGLSKKFGHWRDTHVKMEGPAVVTVQWSFMEDWNWAAHEIPKLHWTPQAASSEMNTLVLPTGPADKLETCSMFFVQAINSAKDRVWIASPYFVPDRQVLCALQMAALRGCDVRIMLPEKPDHLLVYLTSYAAIQEAETTGVRFFRYQPGFLHQKTMIVDDEFAAVGTANLDNRSFRLNFEITIAVIDKKFAQQTEAMFLADFEQCRELPKNELAGKSFGFRLVVSLSRLFSPIL